MYMCIYRIIVYKIYIHIYTHTYCYTSCYIDLKNGERENERNMWWLGKEVKKITLKNVWLIRI